MTGWLSFKPQTGQTVYPCYACRDMYETLCFIHHQIYSFFIFRFISKNSFLDHINRRSILIQYTCNNYSCSRSFVFYNPCSLLLHTRQHYNLMFGEIDLDNVEIHSLPMGMGGFLPHPDIPMLYDVEANELLDPTPLNAKFYSPVLSERGQQKVKLYPNDLLFLYATPQNSSVVLCLKQISSNIPRCEFVPLNGNQILLGPTNVQQNVVSVKVENENGTETTNGSVANNNFSVCPECHQVQDSPMAGHFWGENKPENDNLKCTTCGFIAPTSCSLSAHMRIHYGSTPYICPECGKEFPNRRLLSEHMDLFCFHLAKQLRYRCPGKKCGKLFAQMASFTAHFTAHLECLNECSSASCTGMYFTNSEFIQHLINRHGNRNIVPRKVYKCNVCPENKSIPRLELKEHVEEHVSNNIHKVYAYSCKKCRSCIRSTSAYSAHLVRCLKFNQSEKSENEELNLRVRPYYVTNICFTCNTKFRYKINVTRFKPVSCPNCGEIFDTSLNNLNNMEMQEKCILCGLEIRLSDKQVHATKCKYARPVVVIDSNDINNPPTDTDSNSPKSDDSSKKKKKKSSTTSTYKSKKKEMEETDLYLQPDEPMDFNGTYHCILCPYESEKREEFHSHIVSHRDVSTSYQCMECGECFVVKPSLVKHLHYFHKILNTDEYFEKNDCFDRGAVKELSEIMRLAPGETKGPVEENQCRVCLKKFEDNLELSKHFRVHGMAFLLRNSK